MGRANKMSVKFLLSCSPKQYGYLPTEGIFPQTPNFSGHSKQA